MSKANDCSKANGNCTLPSDDGLPVQCVGPWAKDKHDYVRRYIDASSGPRSKYLKPKGSRPAGGAAFIDLFAGPGRARVRETLEFIDGSPSIAARHAKAPFTRIILCDLEAENTATLRKRFEHDGRVEVIDGDCNETIDQVVDRVPQHGLNLALIDPYGMRAIAFETIRRLAAVKRMDLLIHFPTGDMKRNFAQDPEWFARFVGTNAWGFELRGPSDIAKLIQILRGQLATLGYGSDQVREAPIRNTVGVTLYHLVYASKDPLGDKIWRTIAKIDAKGQRDLFDR